jgi:hypothetical protein
MTVVGSASLEAEMKILNMGSISNQMEISIWHATLELEGL